MAYHSYQLIINDSTHLFTGVFGKQYQLVLIITSRTKPKILGHVVHLFLCFIKFTGCFTNKTRPYGVFWQKKGFKSKVNALSLNCRNLKEGKIQCIKNKGGSTNNLHTFFMTLFSCAGTSSVLEFCIGDLRPVFPMENYILYIENN